MSVTPSKTETIQRIELRAAGGTMLGVVVLETAQGYSADGEPARVIRQVWLEVKRGRRLFEIDLLETILASVDTFT